MYIDVTAVHVDKKLALKNLICQRKLRWTGILLESALCDAASLAGLASPIQKKIE